MPTLKLGISAFFCAKPYNWARTITTTSSSSSTSTTTFITPPPHHSSLSLLPLPLNTNPDVGWTPVACYNNTNNNNNSNSYYCCYTNNNSKGTFLGFTFSGHKRFSLISVSSSSFSRKAASSTRSGSDSPAPGSGVMADMGSENKIEDVDWYSNDILNSEKPTQSPLPSPSMQNHRRQQQEQQQSYSKLLTLPTILTLGRVAAVPLIVATFYVDSWWGRTATTSIFVAAAITDWLDGYLARKMRLGSSFGAFLDPVADKLMVAATLILLCSRPLEAAIFGQVPWLLTVPSIAIIGREITMSAVREWAASKNAKLLEAVAVNNLGKWKTATQMTALTVLLATRDSSLGGPGTLVASGVVLLYISAGLSVWSLAVYMSKIWKVLLK